MRRLLTILCTLALGLLTAVVLMPAQSAGADVDWTYAVDIDEQWNPPTYTDDFFWFNASGPGQNRGLDGYWAYELRTRCTGSGSTASETVRVRLYKNTSTIDNPWDSESYTDSGGGGSYVTDHPQYFHTPNYHDYFEVVVDSPSHHSPGSSPPCEWRLVIYYKAVWG